MSEKKSKKTGIRRNSPTEVAARPTSNIQAETEGKEETAPTRDDRILNPDNSQGRPGRGYSLSRISSIKRLLSLNVFKIKSSRNDPNIKNKKNEIWKDSNLHLPLQRSRTTQNCFPVAEGESLNHDAFVTSNRPSRSKSQCSSQRTKRSNGPRMRVENNEVQYQDSQISSGALKSPELICSPEMHHKDVNRVDTPNSELMNERDLGFQASFQDISSANSLNITIESEKSNDLLTRDDLTCPICLEIFYRPRQLDCKHCFCLLCLQNYANTCRMKLNCPSCRQTVKMPSNGVRGFGRNRHLERSADRLRRSTQNSNTKCTECWSITETVGCHHCDKVFCQECCKKHLNYVKRETDTLRQKLQQLKDDISSREKNEEECYQKLEESIQEAVKQRIDDVNQRGKQLREKIHDVRLLSQKRSSSFAQRVEDLLSNESNEKEDENLTEVATYYSQLSNALSSVPSFEKLPNANLTSLEKGLQDATYDGSKEFSSKEDDLVKYQDPTTLYTAKSNLSKYYKKNICGRPAGIAVSPWSDHLYVTGSDACKVFIFDFRGRHLGQFGSRGHGDSSFLCPAGLVFNEKCNELLVTDKWKHCIHVFDQNGKFLRQIGSKGRGRGQFSSPEGIAIDARGNIYVADTCNGRVQVLDGDGLFLREIGGNTVLPRQWNNSYADSKRELNEPAAVALSKDAQKVYVADPGDHRIKVFDGKSGKLIAKFGSHGVNKGQFNSPEAVAVDDDGFILVGDSGNGRVQILRPDGHFLRYLGTKSDGTGEFGWVSGISLNRNGQIIVTDFKNSQIGIF